MARIEELNRKEVINIKDGIRLGFVCDVEVDTKTGCVVSIIVRESPKLFCFFAKEVEYVIKWCKIETIGEDVILVDVKVSEVIVDC